jgi:hypothetical protein
MVVLDGTIVLYHGYGCGCDLSQNWPVSQPAGYHESRDSALGGRQRGNDGKMVAIDADIFDDIAPLIRYDWAE